MNQWIIGRPCPDQSWAPAPPEVDTSPPCPGPATTGSSNPPKDSQEFSSKIEFFEAFLPESARTFSTLWRIFDQLCRVPQLVIAEDKDVEKRWEKPGPLEKQRSCVTFWMWHCVTIVVWIPWIQSSWVLLKGWKFDRCQFMSLSQALSKIKSSTGSTNPKQKSENGYHLAAKGGIKCYQCLRIPDCTLDPCSISVSDILGVTIPVSWPLDHVNLDLFVVGNSDFECLVKVEW